jgi:tRNA-dihydrouridine synthase 1
MLSRSFMPQDTKTPLLAYTPMFHARLFADTPKYRETAFQPTTSPLPDPPCPVHQTVLKDYDAHLDGNPKIDRPLFVQFCANDPDKLLAAAKLVQPYCDAVDLNLGCPQGIAKKGHYGAFLQEDWDLVFRLINNLHKNLDIPVTAKMRILETKEKTLEYAKTILSAGASIVTVHGRQRHQKGHNTGLADWGVIRWLREQLPPETVMFANGNILQHEDIQTCLDATGVDGVMSAEGNLHDPTIFGIPPIVGEEGREYWRGRDGKGGYRMDAVLRRYMDIIYQYVLQQPVPERTPLFIASDVKEADTSAEATTDANPTEADTDEPPRKKRKKSEKKNQTSDPNLTAMQAHLFQMLRPLITKHTHIRDALAKSRSGDVSSFEKVLTMVEQVTKEGLLEYEKSHTESNGVAGPVQEPSKDDFRTSSKAAMERCKRPWWICQPYIRPLPDEAIAKGAMSMSKKDKKKLDRSDAEVKAPSTQQDTMDEAVTNGSVKEVFDEVTKDKVEVPKQAMVCG